MCNPSLHECKIVCPTFITTVWNQYRSPRVRAIREGIAKVSLCVVLLLTVAVCAHAQNVGDPIVAIPGGYQVIDQTLGTLTTTLAAPSNTDQTADCADDSTDRTRAAIFTQKKVVKYPAGPPFNIISGQTATTTTPPLALVFDGDNNFYVGHPGGTIDLFDASGSSADISFDLSAFIENPLLFSLDIRNNGTTLDFASGGPHIGVFDTTLPISGTNPTQFLVTNTAPITGFSITGGVVTIFANNNFPAGTNPVTISGTIEGIHVFGTVTTSSLTSTQFTFPFDAPDTVGTITVSGTATFEPTLYGIRELPPFDGTGGYVAAIGLDIANISSSTGAVNFYYVKGLLDGVGPLNNKWKTLALDLDADGFWAANLATGNLYKFHLGGGTAAGPFTTAASASNGQGGICLVGGASAAQPKPIKLTATLVPGAGSNSHSFQFTPVTPENQISLGNNVFGIPTQTVKFNETITFDSGSSPDVDATAWFTEIDSIADSPVGTSDGGIPCLVIDDPFVGAVRKHKCGVFRVKFKPDSPADFSGVNLSISTTETLPPGTTTQFLGDAKNVDTAFVLTDFTGGGPRGSGEFNLGAQPLSGNSIVSCGYLSPVTTNPFAPGGTLELKFMTATSQANCDAGDFLNSSSISANFSPQVSVVLLDASGLTGTSVGCSTQGNSSGPCPSYRLVSNVPAVWGMQINTSKLASGCYVVYSTDTSNPPSMAGFSNATRTGSNTVEFQIGKAKCKALP